MGTVGITNYGDKRLGLGPVVAVHLPKVGASVKRRDVIGAIDFAPATSDFHSPVSGQVLEINSVRLLSHTHTLSSHLAPHHDLKSLCLSSHTTHMEFFVDEAPMRQI